MSDAKNPPTMLVIAACDDVVRRGTPSFLVDIGSLSPDPKAFDDFLRDVASALRRRQEPTLAALVEGIRK